LARRALWTPHEASTSEISDVDARPQAAPRWAVTASSYTAVSGSRSLACAAPLGPFTAARALAWGFGFVLLCRTQFC